LVSPYLPEPIAVSAVVRRSERGRGMGVQFLRFEADGLQRLEKLLARLVVTRILVVDDDENIRRVLTFALKKGNYEVLTAADGSEGLQLALTSEPDLIILDLHMPGLSGLEVCQQIRSSPRLAQVPVLILSATREMAEFRSAQELGAVMFIPKPFQPQKLFNQVQILLER
jgi:DNA-binding response OmpR family regulator